MEAGEIIAKITPHPASLYFIPGGLRGLSPGELASIMSGLSEEKSALLRAVELGDFSNREQFILYTINRLRNNKEIHARFKKPNNILQKMVNLAYYELTNISLSRCGKCRGRRIDKNGLTHIPNGNGALIICDACGGSGKRRISTNYQAEIIGIPEATWRQTWRKIYEREVLGLILSWLNSARYYVKTKYYLR